MATRRRQITRNPPAAQFPPIYLLWVLRILVPLGGHREFVGEHGLGKDGIASALGLQKWLDAKDFDPNKCRAELRQLHSAIERTASLMSGRKILIDNVAKLKGLVGLSEADCRILEFAVSLHSERLLDDAADLLGPLNGCNVIYALSTILALPEQDIRTALSRQGLLARSGILSLDGNTQLLMRAKIDLLSSAFAENIAALDADPVMLMRGTVAPAPGPHLSLADYHDLTSSLNILRPYLRNALRDHRRGVNVLLHGSPGTGKTQLGRVLAQDLDCELFEVSSEDTDGDPVKADGRLRAFRAAQSIFAQRRALLLFDEAEDVFDDGDNLFGRKSTAQIRKAWINRSLEDNPVPTVWLSNSIGRMDPAFIRRFDMVFEIPIPTKVQRQRIVQEACGDLLPAAAVTRIAEVEALTPAIVTRAASVIRSVQDKVDSAEGAAGLEALISSTLVAQGHSGIRRNDPNHLPEVYDPAFIQADCDLARVADGLLSARSGRLCLYGPPGTGKTAFGRWLAQQMGVPLAVKRASDLMSKWLGESEKNIAQAFGEAERDKAVLLIDEVDSFLQDRQGAHHSWEISQVNEMLTQMESFPGVFIASTNLMDNLDPASLRRFDLKVKFDYLKSVQATELLRRYCQQLEIAPPESAELVRLSSLHCLTPGDFAAVVRQSQFRPLRSATELVAALQSECALKHPPARPMGFLQ